MRVVVDASILAAALIRPRGWTAQQLGREDVEWYGPAFLFEELEEHSREFADLANCSTSTIRSRINSWKNIRRVDEKLLLDHADHPLERRAASVDPKDAPYFAAVAAVQADRLWTRDRRLLKEFPGLAVRIIPYPVEGED